jgi:hypothetical protein
VLSTVSCSMQQTDAISALEYVRCVIPTLEPVIHGTFIRQTMTGISMMECYLRSKSRQDVHSGCRCCSCWLCRSRVMSFG